MRAIAGEEPGGGGTENSDGGGGGEHRAMAAVGWGAALRVLREGNNVRGLGGCAVGKGSLQGGQQCRWEGCGLDIAQ